MKVFQIAVLLLFTMLSCTSQSDQAADQTSTPSNAREYYQLKVYTFANEAQVNTTDQYLENYYLPALKEKGIDNIGVFKTILSEADSTRKTYVLIPFQSLEQWFEMNQQIEDSDLQELAASKYYQAGHEAPAYQRIESTLMHAFTDMPSMALPSINAPRSERVYELRSYESPTEAYYKRKVDMFNAGGEIKLFDRLGFNAVFYADVLAGADMPNLIYMTTFPDRATRDSLWKEFVDAPEWKAIVDLPKYTNTVSHADIMLLRPTLYSEY